MKLTPWEPDLRSLFERIEAGHIDLQPDFQRQEVWPLSKKKRLIDSILRGWSIPPVHFVVTVNNRMEVLDGQQRLASVRDFFNNRFSIDGSITPLDPNIESLNKLSYSKLDSQTKLQVDHYPLRCFRISEYSPEEPSELFYRLNQPTMLTAGEQRNALYGPARFQLKDLVSYFIDIGNDPSTIGFSNVRLAYDDIIARLLYFLEAGSFSEKGTESRISERFRIGHPFSDHVLSRANSSIVHFSQSIRTAGHYRLNKASLLSWLLFYSRFTRSDPRPDAMTAFLSARNSRHTHDYLSKAAAVFEDRASLRVTDVSSVVLRDISLWYIYLMSFNARLPNPIPDEPLRLVHSVLTVEPDISFDTAVLETIDVNNWGQLL